MPQKRPRSFSSAASRLLCRSAAAAWLAVAGSLATPGGAGAQTAWSTTDPPHWGSFAIAHDPLRQRTVVFGGVGLAGEIAETWEFDGQRWRQRTPRQAPSPRVGAAMAFDAALGRIVLFGGSGQDDTWAWDGSEWQQLTPTRRPPARSYSALVAEPAAGRLVLFGGDAGGSVPQPLNDTWEWRGGDWQGLVSAASPPPRSEPRLAYDEARGQIVLHGGYDSSHAPLGDTWILQGASWRQQQPTSTPGLRSRHGMSFDPMTQQVLLQAGVGTFGAPFYDTWSWDGAEWRRLAPATTPRMRQPMLVRDQAAHRVVAFGLADGSTLPQTWSWNGNAWTLLTPTPPSRRPWPGMAYDAMRHEVILFGGGAFPERGDTWA